MKTLASGIPAEKVQCHCAASFPLSPQPSVHYRCLKSSPPAVPEPSRWQRGFPYFGAVADALSLAGLWSRSELIRFLRGQGHCPPSDRLSCCLCDMKEDKGNLITATIALHDEERGEWHIISLNQ